MNLEELRLENLRSYKILDTPFDKSFDKITKLASAICGAPISVVSLIDSDRQWLKSLFGMEGISETPRDDSFCTHTIETKNILEISDAKLDERFKNKPSVISEGGIRFYAGAPLISPEGFSLGALCVVDMVPRALTPNQREALLILSEQVVELLQLHKANYELHESRRILQEQQELLIKKARHQSLGELAGGLGHQINNPLAIIIGRSMILRSQLKSLPDLDASLIKELDVIDETSARISTIIKALNLHSKDLGFGTALSDISEVISSSITLIRSKPICREVKISFEAKEVKMLFNKFQIGQVFLNLLDNSLEAMEHSEVKEITINFKESSEGVVISFSDSGVGFDQENISKVFDPFFSTRSKNFGLGLFNASKIMGNHNGFLKISNLKNPTVVEVHFSKAV